MVMYVDPSEFDQTGIEYKTFYINFNGVITPMVYAKAERIMSKFIMRAIKRAHKKGLTSLVVDSETSIHWDQ